MIFLEIFNNKVVLEIVLPFLLTNFGISLFLSFTRIPLKSIKINIMSNCAKSILKQYLKEGFVPVISNDEVREFLLNVGININITSKSLESFTLTITSPELDIPNDLERYKFEDFESYDSAMNFAIRKCVYLFKRIKQHNQL